MLNKTCRCGKIIPYNIKLCGSCIQENKNNTKQYKQRYYDRDSKYNKFYSSSEWEKIRRATIVRDKGLCIDCMNNNTITPAYTVHHIIPIKDDWSKRLSMSNLVSLCESHHQLRHKELKEGRGRSKSF